MALFVPDLGRRHPGEKGPRKVAEVMLGWLILEEDEMIAETGIPEVEALARAVRGLSAYRLWLREQAMARDATLEAVEEYVQTTTRLVELDQRYWRAIASANAALIEARRRALSSNE
jgi:hypothetical protein